MDFLTNTKKNAMQFPARGLTLLAFLLLVFLMPPAAGEIWGWPRDLVATPALMGSPLQVIESQMSSGRIQRFESLMLDSPLQLIGSPYGPYRFATIPNLQALWATRRAVSTLPAMLQTRGGMLMILPYYAVPLLSMYSLDHPALEVVEADTLPAAAAVKPAAFPKFISYRCGDFMEMTIPVDKVLIDEERKPC